MRAFKEPDVYSMFAGAGVLAIAQYAQKLSAASAEAGVAAGTAICTFFASTSLVPAPVGWTTGVWLLGAAAWTAWSARKRSHRIVGIEALCERNASAFPFVVRDTDPTPLPSLQEWLSANAGEDPSDDEIGRALSAQLSRRWTGVEAEPEHRRALLALFALRAAQDRSYVTLRDALATSVRGHGSPDEVRGAVSRVFREHVSSRQDAPEEAWIAGPAARHAWSETVIMGALAAARTRALLAEAEFGWLMTADRPLALALNSVGRPSYLPEALGAACHYQEELRAKSALPEPMVSAGVRGIRMELARTGRGVPGSSPS